MADEAELWAPGHCSPTRPCWAPLGSRPALEARWSTGSHGAPYLRPEAPGRGGHRWDQDSPHLGMLTARGETGVRT